MLYYALINTGDGMKWQERNGTKVRNPYGLKLYAEKRGKGCWVITEGQTGFKISEGELRRIAVENFENLVRDKGLDEIYERIKYVIKRYEESPLYTNEPTLPVIPLPEEENE